MLAQISSTSRARFSRGVAGRDQLLDRRASCARRPARSGQAEIGRAHDLALAHRNAAERSARDIRRARCGRSAPRSRRSSPPSLHALGIGGELAHRFDVGRKPGEPMGGALLAVEQPRGRPALQHHALADLRARRPPAAPRRRAVAARARVRRSLRGGRDGAAACGIGDRSRNRAIGTSSLVCSAQIPIATQFQARNPGRNARISDIFNHFRLISIERYVACRPSWPRAWKAAAAMTLSLHRVITRISVRTRIIVLAAIPVLGFLVNGIAFTAGERDVEHAFGTRRPRLRPGRRQPRVPKRADRRCGVRTRDFVAQPSQDLIHALRSPRTTRRSAALRHHRGSGRRADAAENRCL